MSTGRCVLTSAEKHIKFLALQTSMRLSIRPVCIKDVKGYVNIIHKNRQRNTALEALKMSLLMSKVHDEEVKLLLSANTKENGKKR